MLNIYPLDNFFPFPSYIESGLVTIVKEPQCYYVTIDKSDCACNSKNGIAVKNSCMFINNIDNYVKHHQIYFLNFSSEDETETAIFF